MTRTYLTKSVSLVNLASYVSQQRVSKWLDGFLGVFHYKSCLSELLGVSSTEYARLLRNYTPAISPGLSQGSFLLL